jgi:alpha-beta hydrolase superfamily lysophospholipase
LLFWLGAGFLLMNLVAAFHAYQFTHFSETATHKTKDPKSLNFWEKAKALLFGVSNPKPQTKHNPEVPYQTILLNSGETISCWYLPIVEAKGTIILFHGFTSEKSALLERAMLFREMGYSTLLVDFRGSGASSGNQTTIGFKEAQDVKAAFDFVRNSGEQNILLFGNSMGAVAVMKAIKDNHLAATGLILECPFGTLYQTVSARFRAMGVPSFPMAGLLVFWGGVENGFWGFGHNPVDYAESITMPTLLMQGLKDDKVSTAEISEMLRRLKGRKRLVSFPDAGHEDYLKKDKDKWEQSVKSFLEAN